MIFKRALIFTNNGRCNFNLIREVPWFIFLLSEFTHTDFSLFNYVYNRIIEQDNFI